MIAPIYLKLRDLEHAGACYDSRSEFEDKFGSRVLATVSTAVAVATMFDWDWAAGAMLTRNSLVRFHKLLENCSPDGLEVRLRNEVVSRAYAHAFADCFIRQGGYKARREESL